MSIEIQAELKNNKIYFYLSEYLPLDVFSDYNKIMHKLYAQWNKEDKRWTCKLNQFKAISIGLDNESWMVIPSKKVLEKLNELEKGCETKTFRQSFDKSCLNNGIELFDYQLEDINFLVQQNRSYNFNDFGCGKSLSGTALFSFFYMKGFIEKIFYFTKAGLSLDIKRKILKFSNQFKDEDIIICDNDNKLKLFEEYKDKKLFIIGYEFIPYVFCNYCSKMKKGVRSGKSKNKLSDSKKNCRCKKPNLDLKEKLNVNGNMMLICDESHKVMNPDGVWYKLLNNHKEYFEFRHMMSATPNPNRYEQKWSQINLLDESIINLDYKAFCSYISKEQGDEYSNTKIIEYDAEKISKIEDKLKGWGVRRLKSDIKWFTKKKIVDDPIYIELTKEQRELYNLFCNYEFSLLKQEKEVVYEVDILNKFPYMSQIIDYPMMLRDKINSEEIKKLIDKIDFSKTGKMLMLKDMIDDLMSVNEKVIVVDWRPSTLNYMNDYFRKKGYGCEVLHGENEIPKGVDKRVYRQQIIDKFNDKNSDLKILFLSSLVGGAGFDLQYACRNMIINTLSFDAENYMQMCDRIFRIINEWDVRIRMLIYANTLDEKRLRMSLNREKLNNNVSKNNILSKEEYQQLFMGLR